MDSLKLSHIDEELDSTEVAALCFLCLDFIPRKRLEGVRDGKELFSRLEERGLLKNEVFLSQLLHIIRRADLISFLRKDTRQPMETDANPMLSEYRLMLYKLYDNMTQEYLDKMKLLLINTVGRRQMEMSNTALDVFTEMEKKGLISNTDVTKLYETVLKLNKPLASMVEKYIEGIDRHHQYSLPSANTEEQKERERNYNTPVPVSETRPSWDECVSSDAQAESPSHHNEHKKEDCLQSSMAAKDTVRRNKTAIQQTLCTDYRLILNKVYEKDLITWREYNNLKSINKEDVEGHVVELVDKIMSKGEDTCRAFLDLLQTDKEVIKTFPNLKDIQCNGGVVNQEDSQWAA